MASTYGIDAILLMFGMMIGGMIVTWFTLDFFSGKFLSTWIKARMSNNKKLIVRVKSLTGRYLGIGKISNNELRYTPRNSKEEKMLVVQEGSSIYRQFGVFNIDVDEHKNAIMNEDYTSVSGYDAETMGNLLKRAMYTFHTGDKTTKLIMLVALASAVASIICLFMLLDVQNQLKVLTSAGVAGATI